MSKSFNAIILMLSLCLLASAYHTQAADPPASEGSIEVDVTGILHSGILAIGGETTGVTISAKGITWELDFGEDAKLRQSGSKLDGKTVRVRGSLERRKGTEINERWIVTVNELKPVGQKRQPNLGAKTRRADSRIDFSGSGEKVLAEINSTSGIGSATISRLGKSWPKAVVIHLYLRGLESFKVKNRETVVEWSKSSSGNQESRVSLRRAGKERAITKSSPYHSEVKTIGGNGEVPLDKGHFEIALPTAIFEGNPEKITLHWIDFYR